MHVARGLYLGEAMKHEAIRTSDPLKIGGIVLDGDCYTCGIECRIGNMKARPSLRTAPIPVYLYSDHDKRKRQRKPNPHFCSDDCLEQWREVAARVASARNEAVYVLGSRKGKTREPAKFSTWGG